jgi:hypothetical protein
LNITDIPDQIKKALKYSLRSRPGFIISLVTAIIVLGIAYDLVYGFAYVRIYNIKEPVYGWVYGLGLFFFGLFIPLIAGIGAYMRARLLSRPFKVNEIGIAIAPFEVFSTAPETLGTSSTLQALDIVGTQFFQFVENIINEREWAEEFIFRFLPQHIRIKTEKEAVKSREALDAALLVWGVITQRSRQTLEIWIGLQGSEHNYTFSNFTIDKFPIMAVEFFILLEGAKAILKKGGSKSQIENLLKRALPLAEKIDNHDKQGGFTKDVKSILAGLGSIEQEEAAIKN